MGKITLFIFLIFISFKITAQKSVSDSLQIRAIYNEVLENGEAYENLRYLCKEIGPRLSGSENAAKSVTWIQQLMQSYGFDKVWLQEVMVEHWVRGEKETCVMHVNETDEYRQLSICALGRSIGTNGQLSAPVIEVSSLEDLKGRLDEEIKGKIVFINQPMNQKYIETFRAYSEAGSIRYNGASEAAAKGAIGVINRSLSTNYDDNPHTGAMKYKDSTNMIPAAAISIVGAELLHKALKKGRIDITMKMSCQNLPDAKSYNVIGQITGSKYPDEIIVVGGHLDSWDLAEGAHDDGAGVMQSVEVLRLFKKLGIQPEHTIRTVLFMNEENGLRGGKAYARSVMNSGEKHIYAIESDAGGYTPRGFSFDVEADKMDSIKGWKSIFEPYLTNRFIKGYGGADIGPLKPTGTILIGYRPDSERYFDMHHSANDVFEAVNKRELHLGAAGMAALIYLLDRYGLPGEE